MNIDSVTRYFTVLAEAIADVEQKNGHSLKGDEIMNVDETGVSEFSTQTCMFRA
jgi:hypothetical protein